MQIEKIILYSHDGRIRSLRFNLDGVTIITGDSATGKSSIIEIVDYCLGAKECRVPDGVIRDSVSWYALKLKSAKTGELFVARKSPDRDAKSTHLFSLREGGHIEIPELADLEPTHNLENSVLAISRFAGMRPNETQLDEFSTRKNYNIDIRQAIKLCLQYQDEIASKRSLFHQQSEGFIAQSIIDSLPYFFGFQKDDYLLKLDQLKRAKREATLARRRLAEFSASATGGFDTGVALLAEARNVGIISHDAKADTSQDLLGHLESALASVSRLGRSTGTKTGDELTNLQRQMTELEVRRQELHVELSAAQSAMRVVTDTSTEMVEQRARLSFASLIGIDVNEKVCPLCQQSTNDTGSALPQLVAVKKQFTELTQQLKHLEEHQPDLSKFISTLTHEITTIDAKVAGLRSSIRQLRQGRQDQSSAFDLSVRQALVLGRIKQYLDGMRPNLSEGEVLQRSLRQAERLVAELASEVEQGDVERQLRSVADRLQPLMTEWASALQLEFSGNPFRIDFQKLTVEVIRQDSPLPIPLYRMGSGKNWLGCHLISHFALHDLFVKQSRPIPRFLILDQPTQVFYPPDEVDNKAGDVSDLTPKQADPSEDRDIVQRIFGWIFSQTKKINESGGFQVIVTDHAELQTEDFQQAHAEPRWLSPNRGLIPSDWPRQQS